MSSSNRTSDDESPRASPAPDAPHSAPPKRQKEKRKRTRVTPEQLTHLERFFLIDRCPTAVRRRDISKLLGMHERQTQIWFQNRRAKAKLQDTKHAPPRDPDAPADAPQPAVHELIHEDDPVSIVPCTDLTVGDWRRISSPGDVVHDLVAYISEPKRCLNWFVLSAGYGFKMEIPFATVTDTDYKIISPHSAAASFVLSEPPLFYQENFPPLAPAGDAAALPRRTWVRCSDWTEGLQASKVLRHTVLASDAELVCLLRILHAALGSRATPGFRPDALAASPMELQPPPLAGLGVVHSPSYPETDTKNHRHHTHPHAHADFRSSKSASYSLPAAAEPRFSVQLTAQPPSAPFPRGVFHPQPHQHAQQAHAQHTGVYTGPYSADVQPAPGPSSYPPLAGPAGLYARGYEPHAQPYYDDARILQPFGAADVDDTPRITASPTDYHPNMHRDARQPHQRQALHPGTSNNSLGMMSAATENNTYSC